jgi:ribosomal protein L22
MRNVTATLINVLIEVSSRNLAGIACEINRRLLRNAGQILKLSIKKMVIAWIRKRVIGGKSHINKGEGIERGINVYTNFLT